MRSITFAMLMFPCAVLALPPTQAMDPPPQRDRAQKRIRFIRSVGIVEALDLDGAPADKVRAILARYSARCEEQWGRGREALRVLRRAAAGDQAAETGLEESTRRLLDAQAQLEAIHRELFENIATDLTPAKRARALVFLTACRGRFGAAPELIEDPLRARRPAAANSNGIH